MARASYWKPGARRSKSSTAGARRTWPARWKISSTARPTRGPSSCRALSRSSFRTAPGRDAACRGLADNPRQQRGPAARPSRDDGDGGNEQQIKQHEDKHIPLDISPALSPLGYRHNRGNHVVGGENRRDPLRQRGEHVDESRSVKQDTQSLDG